MHEPIAQGEPVPRLMLARLHDSTAAYPATRVLRRRLERDGYLWLRGLLDPAAVLAARREVLARLASVGEVEPPSEQGIATGVSFRRERAPDLGSFWKSVSEGPRLRAVTHGSALRRVIETIVGEPVVAHDYVFLRPAPVGRSTGPHCDFPFFARRTERVLTVWTALGPVPLTDGPAAIVEGSHRSRDLIDATRGFDVALHANRRATRTETLVSFARSRGARLLSADFGPGDLLVFGLFTWHGSLDNQSPLGRLRLSIDVRFQPACEPRDPRYFGVNPGGTTGAGYGELNGAKPLTESWHVR